MAEEIIIKVNLEGANKQLDTLNALQEEINSLAQEKKKLTKAEKDLEKAIDETAGATAEQTATAKDLAEQQVENNLILKETKQEFNQTEKAVLTNAKANKLAAGSVAQLAAQHIKDKDALRQLSKADRENTKEGRALTKTVKDQSDELKELEKSYGTTSRSVGDYGIATQEVLPLMGGFGSQIQSVIGSLGGIKSAIGKFSVAQKGLTTSTKGANSGLKAFRIALISTGIGAIVVLLGSLLAAFSSTQRGADAFTKILRPLQQILQGLLGVAQRLSTDALDGVKKAFDNPRDAVIKLGKAIKENFINRMEAIPIVAKSIVKAVVGTFDLIGLGIKSVLADVPLIGKLIDKDQLQKDLEETKKETIQAFKDLGTGTIQLQTGIDEEGQKKLFDQVTNFVEGNAARGTAIDQLMKQISQAAISLRLETERGNLEFVKQKELVQNTLLTDKERLAAAEKAKIALQEITKLQVDQKNREIELARLNTLANDTDREAQKELQDLIADRERLEADAITKRIEIGNQANGIIKTRIATDKKAIEDNKKAEEKASKDKLKDESALIDKKIEGLELARQLELATIDETNDEKIKKESDLLDTISALRIEKAKKDAELKAEEDTKALEKELASKTELIKDEQERKKAAIADEAIIEVEKSKIIAEAVLEQDLLNKINKAEAEQVVQEEIDTKELEQEAKKEEGRELIKNAAFQAGESFVNEAFNNQERRIKDGLTRETEALKLKRQAGEISEEEFAAKRLELEQKAFKDRKRLSLAQNAVDFAVGVGKTIAQFGLNPITLIPALTALAIQKASSAAIIASQKFSRGGVIHGASHAQGGVQLGNNQEGEGGEAVINKRSTAKHLPLLSAINQDGGGVPLTSGVPSPNLSTVTAKFANGGVADFGGGSTLNLDDLRQAFSETIGTIKVQNVASETTGVANRVQQIEDSASF